MLTFQKRRVDRQSLWVNQVHATSTPDSKDVDIFFHIIFLTSGTHTARRTVHFFWLCTYKKQMRRRKKQLQQRAWAAKNTSSGLSVYTTMRQPCFRALKEEHRNRQSVCVTTVRVSWCGYSGCGEVGLKTLGWTKASDNMTAEHFAWTFHDKT